MTNEETTVPADLSIVLIVRHPRETPDAVLSALATQLAELVENAQIEVILVDGRPSPSQAHGKVPCRLLRLRRPELNMPLLKAQGLAVARGRLVAFLEPKAVPVDGWLRAALSAIAKHPGAILGGAVTLGRGGAVDRAAYVFEYSMFSHAALARGNGSDFPGNNMILPAAKLRDLCADILSTEGMNKPFCQARLTGDGVDIVMVPEMAVQMSTHHRLGSLLESRFQYARCFGGTRIALATPKKRWFYRLGTPVIPFLLLKRHLGNRVQLSSSGTLGFRGLAALAVLCLVWSAGEAAGSWTGTGNSCKHLF